jgi:hypothetical protein
MAAAALVDVAARNGKPDQGGLALAMAFGLQDVMAVAGESSTVKSGLAQSAWDHKVPAFDSLGTEVGRYSLVALLSGAKPGLYGSGGSATAAYPALPKK